MTTSLKINGETILVDLSSLPPDITLNTFIRDHAQLTATKFMCLEGGCGACVVAVRRKHPATGIKETFSVNSCLTLLNVCKNWEIITDEGIGNKVEGYHPIQHQLAALSGTQCGFCTPGFVMTMFSLLESNENNVSVQEVENAFGGNICRCTGYRPILDAMKSFASDSNFAMLPELQDIEDLSNKLCPKRLEKCELMGTTSPEKVVLYDDGTQWYWPKSFKALFQALDDVRNNDKFILVAGSTAHGVYRRPYDIKYFIDINNIPELKQNSLDSKKLTLGANLSLTESMKIFKQASNTAGFEFCQSLYNHFDAIANPSVRNVGTLAGNISIKKAHPEFPSDVFILFECLDVTIIVKSSAVVQKSMSLKEYMGNTSKKLVIVAFQLKARSKEQFLFMSYKVMRRAQNAHAVVNAAFLLELNLGSDVIKTARICFGGIRPDFVHLSAAESMLTGKSYYDGEAIGSVITEAAASLRPNAVLPDASPEYRTLLACSLLYRFFLSIAPADKVKPEFQSGAKALQRPLSSGYQEFETVNQNYPVHQPILKLEGLFQCSGEAKYMNDHVTAQNTGYCAFVTATKVGATIQQIDAKSALQLKGVLAFYTAKDIPGKNISFEKSMFLGVEDEEVFCSGTVKYYNQPLGVIVASSSGIAHRAASMVNVMYTNATDKILTNMDDVLDSNLGERLSLAFATKIKDAKVVFDVDISYSGTFKMGPQYHFTMEPQTTVVVPCDDRLDVWCSTQCMDHVQTVIALTLSLKLCQVQLQVRRLGGGFGAKYTRGNQVACAAALAAYKLNRPIRFVQSIESMMNCNGKRWACRSDYTVSAKKNGKVVGLQNIVYEDAGYSLNENPIDYLKGVLKNVYEFSSDNFKVEVHDVLTDAASSTFMRGPGSLEGIGMMENIIERLAFEANIDPAEARTVNIKTGSQMNELLPQFLEWTEYKKRQKIVEEFNINNRWCKRGLGLSIMEFQMSYVERYSATVAIYHYDGSVAISHGGIEMGQGMNTKVAQVAAFVLGIPLEFIKIEKSDTLNGANSGPTGGSVSSEVLCAAVRNACETLQERLKPIRNSLKSDASWQEVVKAAHEKLVLLIASDYCKEGDLDSYAVHGLALSEVEVDVLTGNVLIRRVDIFEDLGESLNPLLDVGQVEGAFVMGLGYWLTEQLIYERQTGRLLTNRTWNYKPPGAKDIPIDFRIKISQKHPNPGGFMRSKATGEPPMCLSIGLIFAIQQAMQSARKDAGLKREWVELGAPTTPETIALNCGTDVSSFQLSK